MGLILEILTKNGEMCVKTVISINEDGNSRCSTSRAEPEDVNLTLIIVRAYRV